MIVNIPLHQLSSFLQASEILFEFDERLQVEDFEAVFEQMSEIILSYQKDDEDGNLIVYLGDFIHDKWKEIVSKLDSEELLTKITFLRFDESQLDIDNLKDLHSLFLKHQTCFPEISIDDTPAQDNFQDFKNLFPDGNVEILTRNGYNE